MPWRRKTAPAAAARAAGSQTDLTTNTFSHSGKDMHVTVEKPEQGFMCTLSMLARVPLPPDRLYELLVDSQQCLRIFKTLKRVNHRRVLSEDAQGNRVVEVDQTGAWRFLMFRGTFTVRLHVTQRRQERTITFRLARPGFMRDFSGTWQILPYDNASLDRLANRHRPSPMHRLQSGLRAVEAQLGLGGGQGQESLVQLQQSIAPAVAPPAAVVRVLQRIAAKQIVKIMSDLQEEVARINASSSSGSSTSSTSTSGGSGASISSSGGGNGSGGSSTKTGSSGPQAAHQHQQQKDQQPSKKQQQKEQRQRQQEEQQAKKHLAAHVRPLQ